MERRKRAVMWCNTFDICLHPQLGKDGQSGKLWLLVTIPIYIVLMVSKPSPCRFAPPALSSVSSSCLAPLVLAVMVSCAVQNLIDMVSCYLTIHTEVEPNWKYQGLLIHTQGSYYQLVGACTCNCNDNILWKLWICFWWWEWVPMECIYQCQCS